MTDFEEAIAVIGSELGLELQVHDGVASFDATVDMASGASIRIDLTHLPEKQKVLVSARLGELPQEGGEALCRTLLEANNFFEGTGGATFSVEPETQQISLEFCSPLNVIGDADDVKLVEYFLNIAESWRKRIAEPSEISLSEMPHFRFIMV